METSSRIDTDLNIKVIRVIKKLRGRMDELNENMNKEIVRI